MAVNLASKYSEKIDEKFLRAAVTTPAVNNDYDFVGVKTVNVYSVGSAKLNDYKRTGANRYGTPEELDTTVQEMTLSQDKAFTFTIDRGNYEDAQMVLEAGKALKAQIDGVVVPEMDKYRLGKIVAGAGKTATLKLTKSNAYEAFLDGCTELGEQNAPEVGRVAYVSPAYYKLLKLDDSFIKASDLAQEMLIKGQVGMVDGVAIVMVPTSYLPEDVQFVITNAVATVGPVKLAEYKIHEDAPGINGWLVEGRIYYDAFVLNNKKGAIYVHKTANA